MTVCEKCGRSGTRGFVLLRGVGDGGYGDQWMCASGVACNRRAAAVSATSTEPDKGEAQGEAAASRSGQGSLDGTAPAPGSVGAAVSPTPEEAAATVREALVHVYTEDGIQPALIALDVLVAALRDARREASMAASNISLADAYRTEGREQTLRANRMERERDQARDALAHFANPQHWAIRRGTFAHPDCVWIGTHTQTPVDLARAALGSAAEETG